MFCLCIAEEVIVSILCFLYLPVPVFGIDITSQFDVHMQPAPTVVLKCIEAVESRGMYIYSTVEPLIRDRLR